MGVVYEAVDRQRETRVALKMLRNLDGKSLLRFKREYRSLQGLHHPNLVNLGDLVEETGSWFFTMDLVRGVDFLRHVRGPLADGSAATTLPATGGGQAVSPEPVRGHFDEGTLRAAMRQLVDGLAFLHAQGKLHRDLKPSNVLVDQTEDVGRVVILDLGLVSDAIDHLQSADGLPVGTAAYMSPEQGAGKPLGPESDWYSVGVILYQALTGRLPHTGSALEVLFSKRRDEPVPPASLTPGVPADLDQLCRELLRIDPASRPREADIIRLLGAAPPRPWSRPAGPMGEGALFVGRPRELALLRQAFREAAAGAPRTVLVHGDSGVGKSALVRHFAETLPRDALVLTGRCTERESVPYRAVDGIVDALSGYLARLPTDDAAIVLPRMTPLLAQLFPVLLRVEPVARAPRPQLNADPHEVRRRAFEALRELLAGIADRRPLVVVIDDLQWADADSLGLLGEVLREPDGPAMLFVGIARSLPAGQGWTARALRLDVAGLPASEAQDLAAFLLQRSAAAAHASAAAVAEAAAGHPLFIATLVRHAQARADGAARPLALDEVLWSEVEELPADARALLEILCIASVPLRTCVALRTAGLSSTGGAAAIATLRACHLLRLSALEELEPYHDRVRETVIAHLPAEVARARHERLASALTVEPEVPAETLAIHWRAAGNEEYASEFAHRAAEQAYETLAFARAARLYRMTLELVPADHALRPRILPRLGDSLRNAGHGAEAADAYLSAKELATGAEALRLQRLRVDCLLASGRIDEGIAAVKELLGAVALRFPKSQGRALAHAVAMLVWLKVRGFGFRQRAEGAIAPERLARIDACQSVGHGLNAIDVFRAINFSTRTLVLALREGEPKRIAVSLAHHAVGVAVGGGASAARNSRRLLERARSVAESTRDARSLALVRLHTGSTAFIEMRFGDALPLLESVEREFREEHPGALWEISMARALLPILYYHLGRLAPLGQVASSWHREAEQRGDVFLSSSASTWPAHLPWLAEDAPDRAQERLTSSMAAWTKLSYQLQHWTQLLGETDIDLYRGVTGSALERFRRHERPLRASMILRAKISATQHFESRARATLAEAVGRKGSVRIELGAQAAADAARVRRKGGAWGRGMADLLDGSIEAMRGRSDEAVRHLRGAVTAFDSIDHALYAAVARWRLGDLVGGDEGAALRAEGQRFMSTAAVRAPERLLHVFSPGFTRA
jgi:hypothetical protein